MAIKTNYNFKGIEVKDAIIRVINLSGSSSRGWDSLVGVYNTIIETVPATDEQEEATREVVNLIEEFNHSVDFKEDERGYVTVYKSLIEKYGGVEV